MKEFKEATEQSGYVVKCDSCRHKTKCTYTGKNSDECSFASYKEYMR